MRKLIMAGALALFAAALCSCSSPHTGEDPSQANQGVTTSLAPTTTVDPGPVIALNQQDQAFVDGLKAHGLYAGTATPNFARNNLCDVTKSINNFTDAIGNATGHPAADTPLGQRASSAYQGMLQQAGIEYKDPDQAKFFVDSTIATYCDDLSWIEPLP